MFKVITAQENYFQQLATAITDQNLLFEKKLEEDPRTEETHKIIHKTKLVDQIVRKTNIEIVLQTQTQLEVITRTIKETVHIQISEQILF